MILLLTSIPVFAQSVDTAWVRRYGGSGQDWAYAIAVDGSANVYVTGSAGGDYATIKYYPNGDTAWVRRYNGGGKGEDQAYDIAVDNSGNVYVTGWSVGSSTSFDYATIKYYPNGNTAWVRRYNGPGGNHEDRAFGIAVDDSGNVYVTGRGSGDAYATIKYNETGEELWVRSYASGWASAIATDGSGNVYVTGYNHVSNYDYGTMKFYPNGDTAWVRRYNGPGNGNDWGQAIAVDVSNNVYVTGYSQDDYATIKYYPNGDTAWVRRYDGPGNGEDRAFAIAVDDSGSCYVTGWSYGSGSDYDYATIRYYPNGDTAWVRRYNGPGNGEDWAWAVAVDDSGNAYVTGGSVGSDTDKDYATIKYDASGNELWVERYNGPGDDSDRARAIAVDGSGNIYVTGRSEGSGTYHDYATIKYVQSEEYEPFYFVHITDTHYGKNGARVAVKRLIDEILTWDPKPAFVIVTGDILDLGWCSPPVPPVCPTPFFEQESNDYSVFEGDFQRLVDNGIPYFVCPGNHDYYSWPFITWDLNLSKYDDHFPISFESEIIQNSLHIISINSGGDELSESPFRPPKGNGLSDLDWMEEILDALDGDPDNNCDVSPLKKVIMMHHPTINYLSGATHGDLCLCWAPYYNVLPCDSWDAGVPLYNREQFKQLCNQYEVDVVCSGHIHKSRTYDATMDWSDWEGDQDGYDKAYCPSCPDPENYPLSTSDKTLYEYTGAAYHGAYRILWVESDGIMVHDANVLDDIIIATVFGCPATLHLYDSTGNHVGRNDGVGVEFEIEDATYSLMPIGDTVETDPTLWEHTEEEISIVCGADDFRYELNGTGDGVLFFSVKKDMPGGSYIRLFYDSLTVTANSIGKLYVNAGSLDYTIYMDDDGDGIIDREIQPDIVNVMLRGDANGDGIINIGDVVYLINYLYRNGTAPDHLEAGDANCDGVIDIGDVVHLINYLYRSGPPPCR